MNPQPSNEYYAHLFSRSLIPLRVVVGAISVGFYDYLLTLDDEIRYVWVRTSSRDAEFRPTMDVYRNKNIVWDAFCSSGSVIIPWPFCSLTSSKSIFFSIPGVATLHRCTLMDPITRLAGALSLWSVQIYMQLRVYALYNRSKKIALFNGIAFITSIGLFLALMIFNATKREVMIARAVHLPLPGCPTINGGLQWTLWIPASGFEIILFFFALAKAVTSVSARFKLNGRFSLTAVLLADNMIYFLSIMALLVFNNLMSVGATRIPWFGMAPFHAVLGIVTGRIMINVYKFTDHTHVTSSMTIVSRPLAFARSSPPGDDSNVGAPRSPSSNSDNKEASGADTVFDEDADPSTPILRGGSGSATRCDLEATVVVYANKSGMQQSCPMPGPSRQRSFVV